MSKYYDVVGKAPDVRRGYKPPGTSTTERGGEKLRFGRSREPAASEPLRLELEGEVQIETAKWPRRLIEMHLRYGSGPEGAICGGCSHLEGHRQSTTWFKCGLARITGGQATDWRKKWRACGKFEARP